MWLPFLGLVAVSRLRFAALVRLFGINIIKEVEGGKKERTSERTQKKGALCL